MIPENGKERKQTLRGIGEEGEILVRGQRQFCFAFPAKVGWARPTISFSHWWPGPNIFWWAMPTLLNKNHLCKEKKGDNLTQS
jgi:hypothetical protein